MLNVVNPDVETARPVTPLGILVEHLQKTVEIVEQNLNIPTEIAANLHKALHLAAGLDPYISEHTSQESEALRAIARATAKEAWNKRFQAGETARPLEQEMLSGHVEGQTLKMFACMTKATSILDIGMFTGYSALAMAEALPPDGHLVACEVDPYVAEFAQNLFQQSPHGQKIRVELGTALNTLQKLADAGESFELVFIDADKQEYVKYFNCLLDMNLLAPKGFICADNTLLQGEVYLPQSQRSANGEAIAEFNRIVAQDKRVEQVILPLRDGLSIIRRL